MPRSHTRRRRKDRKRTLRRWFKRNPNAGPYDERKR